MEQQCDQLVLEQFYSVQEKLDKILEDYIVNIFTLYDINGEGELTFQNFSLFIGDLLYISVLMKRMDKSEYTEENIIKYVRWAGGNFPSNLISGTMGSISYYIFTKGILFALNGYQYKPITTVENSMHMSLLPEFYNYFNHYNDVAIRRGWPLYRRMSQTRQQQQQQQHPQPQPQPQPIIRTVTIEGSLHVTGDVVIEGDLSVGNSNETPSVQEPPSSQEQPEPPSEKEQEETSDISNNVNVRPLSRAALAAIARANGTAVTHTEQPVENVPVIPSGEQPQSEPTPEHAMIDQQLHFDEPPKHDNPEYKLIDAGIFDLCNNEMGFDAIEGDINVVDYIESDKNDNLAFKIGHAYYLSKKSQIMTMVNRGHPGNSIFYACSCVILGDWTGPEAWGLLDTAVSYKESFFNIQHLGLPVRYVRLNDIGCILGGADNYFIIEKPLDAKPFPAFASDNVLNHGIGSMSGNHCQDGQEDIIYDIKTYTPNIIIVSEPKKEETDEFPLPSAE
uniref:EF-hand domain-containing protein n=1 Tax=viral metagenome TaxID=1070528 RepID=A0A6C0DR48_9ZZZZ